MTSASLHPAAGPARRTVVAAAGAAGLAAALTACGSGDGSSGGGDTGSGPAGTALAKTADIPEGGGKVFKDQGVVVTQPAAGTYKAFSAKCTHQGCAVSSVANGVIVCPCHGSQFSAEDGSVRKGPATQPLAGAKIAVSGDEITLA
ncbi:Rieske 2Fe-2S domain-containing protein [Streptomyces sp. SID486]|uniref:Rieske (2Fe-2S) protein n=1 Tax=Streptomyces sp. SID486 TaxID=2690264 RepID=UPI00137048F7|nr:Rieske (2Fe-2S) protein [Streptomyces sp. SID486]MYW17808.1 Rieske 2Fe-2S domain-containing protein [Streptomyces sp. SID2955]MYX95454.1 Rieske 2Fe-2S domain-containing protein [Streptomyces sp. SID486]